MAKVKFTTYDPPKEVGQVMRMPGKDFGRCVRVEKVVERGLTAASYTASVWQVTGTEIPEAEAYKIWAAERANKAPAPVWQ